MSIYQYPSPRVARPPLEDGIGGGKVSGKLGEITLVLVDKSTISPVIKAEALLLDDDSVPFLIGFEDIMTDIKLVCDYATKTSYFYIS